MNSGFSGQNARGMKNVIARGAPAWRTSGPSSVRRISFEETTGRARGTEDRTAFARKGVAGDWVHWFDRETGRLFDETAGGLLVSLGYATDRRWFER